MVLSDNEWSEWLQWMKTAFERDEILDYWKNNIQPEKRFDPALRLRVKDAAQLL